MQPSTRVVNDATYFVKEKLKEHALISLSGKRQPGLGGWVEQAQAVQEELMPHLLRTLDNLEEYVTENGCHIYDLMANSTTTSLPPLVVKAVKDVVQKVAPEKSKKNKRRILDSSSESDEEKTPEAGSKRVTFSSPLTEVKGTL